MKEISLVDDDMGSWGLYIDHNYIATFPTVQSAIDYLKEKMIILE